MPEHHDREPDVPSPPPAADNPPTPSAGPGPHDFSPADDRFAHGILQLLADRGEMYTSHLCRALRVTGPTVAARLRALRAAGLIRSRRVGRRAYHALADVL
jgi:DNA-binding transcriptional ArsR family regulator